MSGIQDTCWAVFSRCAQGVLVVASFLVFLCLVTTYENKHFRCQKRRRIVWPIVLPSTVFTVLFYMNLKWYILCRGVSNSLKNYRFEQEGSVDLILCIKACFKTSNHSTVISLGLEI